MMRRPLADECVVLSSTTDFLLTAWPSYTFRLWSSQSKPGTWEGREMVMDQSGTRWERRVEPHVVNDFGELVQIIDGV